MIVPPMPPIAATIAVMEIQRVWGRRTSADERDVRRRSRVDVRVVFVADLDANRVFRFRSLAPPKTAPKRPPALLHAPHQPQRERAADFSD